MTASYRKRIKSLPCVICGDNTSTEAAHVRYSEWAAGKINPGMAKKPGDQWLISLCSRHHQLQHLMNERAFWHQFRINPVIYCTLLHQCNADINQLPEILARARIKQDSELIVQPRIVPEYLE